jgi:tetratricopeptide (TPR) repeat protein
MPRKTALALAAAGIFCLSLRGWGQSQQVDCLRGELQADAAVVSELTVALTDPSGFHATANVGADGTFEFHRLPVGQYNVAVLEDGNSKIYETSFTVQDQTSRLVIQVPRRDVLPPPCGPVSVLQLLHPPAKKAIDAFNEGAKFAAAGENDKAAESLEKAIQISPYYAEAYIDLAVQHMLLHRYQLALDELTRASEIVKPTARILANMAYAQFSLQRAEDAKQSARQAIWADPSYAPAHYLLGSLLANDPATLSEAAHHLELAAPTIPAAADNLEVVRRKLALTAAQR